MKHCFFSPLFTVTARCCVLVSCVGYVIFYCWLCFLVSFRCLFSLFNLLITFISCAMETIFDLESEKNATDKTVSAFEFQFVHFL